MRFKELIDLTGQTFGNYTVLHRDSASLRSPRWVCRCVCGNIKSVLGQTLRERDCKHCEHCLREIKAAKRKPDPRYAHITGENLRRVFAESGENLQATGEAFGVSQWVIYTQLKRHYIPCDAPPAPLRITCEECGESFTAIPCRSLTARFCSRSCSGKHSQRRQAEAKKSP